MTMFHKESHCSLSRHEIEDRASSLLSQMSLKEKVWLLNGNWDAVGNVIKHKNPYNPTPIKTNGLDRLGINPVAFTDGPRGVVLGNSTCFPVSMARGASFDRDLERRVGDVIGKESRAQGANLFAGVCINLLRHPAWGRAQETYGEDPYHVGEMGKALTESVQEHNVMACLKHYAVNNIENNRFTVDVRSDERTLREIYLPHFKKSIDAGAASVMGAYNQYAGDHCCESTKLLTEILREEWQFEGFTISDFLFGIYDTRKAIEAGLDIEMPMPIKYQKHLLEAVKKGQVSETVIDQSVLRVLKTQLVFENCPDKQPYTEDLVACREHILLAREVAEKSMVLIKNEGDILPFAPSVKKVLVVGKLAGQANTGDHGSSRIFAPYVVTQLEGFKNYFGDRAEIIYCNEVEIEKAKSLAPTVDCVVIIAGCDFNDEGEFVMSDPEEFAGTLIEGYRNQGMQIKGFLIKLFLKIFARGSYQSKEGAVVWGDRNSLSLKQDEIRMIQEIGGLNPNTVVSLIGGSMMMTKEWDHCVPAIIYSWYSGMEGGNALPRILFGDVNPSGKMPFTIPKDESHLPYFSNTDDAITYDLYHGYSLLDKNGQQPAYPFGFGLSYTKFEFTDPALIKDNDAIDVHIVLKNTGHRDGEEVVQVYIGVKESQRERQKKLLKGFEKVFLRIGESREIVISVDLEELKFYSSDEGCWVFEPGTYIFYVGPSSEKYSILELEIESI